MWMLPGRWKPAMGLKPSAAGRIAGSLVVATPISIRWQVGAKR